VSAGVRVPGKVLPLPSTSRPALPLPSSSYSRSFIFLQSHAGAKKKCSRLLLPLEYFQTFGGALHVW
jgi:hypothetical protein